MVQVDATEFKKRSGELVERAIKEEVIIRKRKRPVAVVVDYEKYMDMKKKLEDLEDKLWAIMAEKVMESGEFIEVTPEQLR